jgi:hypothetical protein
LHRGGFAVATIDERARKFGNEPESSKCHETKDSSTSLRELVSSQVRKRRETRFGCGTERSENRE